MTKMTFNNATALAVNKAIDKLNNEKQEQFQSTVDSLVYEIGVASDRLRALKKRLMELEPPKPATAEDLIS